MEERVRFQILGPTRLRVGPNEISINSIRDRMFLASLILNVGEPVPSPYLVDAIWGDRPPRDSRNQLHGCVWRLRRLLVGAGGSRLLIATDPAGYRLTADTSDIDLYEFRQLRDAARRVAAEGDRPTASQRYRAALVLWRGPALADIESEVIQRSADALDEERVQAIEECYEVELADGKADELIPELTERVRQHPYREKLHGALMVALYRAGRQSDALTAYRDIRQTLLDELGSEPGGSLQELHRAILNQDPSLDVRPRQATHQPVTAQTEFRPAVPRTLPPDIPDFVGREKEMALVLDVLTRGEGRGAPVVVVTGPAGVGKTALSVRVAHELRRTYQDGQLYVDLHGFDAEHPVEPFEVLGRFLRSLGVDGAAMPGTLDERAELYRNLLANSAILVVLDNAATEQQVLPLIPNDDAAGVIISSRLRLGSVFGAEMIEVDVFGERTAANMISVIAGAQRASVESDAVLELARLCDHLPLAVRVAAGRLATKPHWRVEQLVHQLRDERRRLDHLAYGTLDVRASIATSYGALPDNARCLLRRLGHLDFPEVGSWLSAAVLDASVAAADDALEQLFDAQLIEFATGGSLGPRYRLHDLIRIFAREQCAREESPAALEATLTRALGTCLFLTTAAYRVMFGGDHQNIVGDAVRWAINDQLASAWVADPLSWFDAEQPTITALIHRAMRDNHSSACWELACTASPLYQTGRYYDEWQPALQAALAEAQGAEDRRGQAAILYRLGWLYTDYTEYERAKDYLDQSTELFRQLGDDHGFAIVVANVGMIERYLGHDDAALARFRAALPLLRRAGDRWTEAFAIRSIAQVHLKRGDHASAEEGLADALTIYKEIESLHGQAQAMFWQGMLFHRQERYEEARSIFSTALGIVRSTRDRSGQAQCLRGLGMCYQGQGDVERARQSLHQALDLIRQPRPTHLQSSLRKALAELE